MGAKREDLIYLYCITKTKPLHTNFKEIKIKIYPIYFQGTYAIVSKVSPSEFSEDNLKKNLAKIEWVEKKVRQHEKIIEEIMRETTVLPFKFATIFKFEENVKELLMMRNADFKKMISDLGGKDEWGLKIYCDLGRFKDTLKNEDEKLEDIGREIDSAEKGKAYLLKKKRDELIKNVINEKISEYTQDSFDRLKRQSQDAKINKLLPKEVTQKKEKMVLNAAFLIDKKRIKEFDNILAYLRTKYGPKGLEFDWTGPWPSYNFCSIDEKEGRRNE